MINCEASMLLFMTFGSHQPVTEPFHIFQYDRSRLVVSIYIYTHIVGLWETLLRVWEQQIDEHHEHPDLQPTPPQRSWNSGIASREKVEACDSLPRDLQQVLGLDPSDWLAVLDHVESCWIRYWIMFPWICQFPWPFLVSIIFDKNNEELGILWHEVS